REFALRALADDLREKSSVPRAPFVSALGDANARVRQQAVTGLGRLGKTEAASAVLPLVTDSDPVVAHLAVHSLVQLRAADVCLSVFDSSSADLLAGAGRVLQALHEPRVVDGLIARLAQATNAGIRETILKTLARLAHREADWDGRWWGTRPDTTGPYFKPVKWSESEKIENVLRAELARADVAALPALAITLQKNRVEIPELTPAILKLAEGAPKFRTVAVEMFASRATLPDEAVALMAKVAGSSSEDAALRAKTIRALAKSGQTPALDAAVNAPTQTGQAPKEIGNAWTELARDTRNSRNVSYFTNLAENADPERRLLAYAVLANIASGRVSDRNGKAAAVRAVEAGWSSPTGAVSLLQAINRLKLDGYAAQVRGLLNDPRLEVANAARVTAGTLKLDVPQNTGQATIEKLNYDDVLAAAAKEKGEIKAGAEIFTKVGCVACHTTSADELLKGPFLGGITTRYSRAELCESILKPNAKIAQGFETQWFKTKDDEEIEGFVTREGGDDLDVRNVAGITATLAKKNIIERGQREKSVMPEGLVDMLTPGELASLLAFLESTKSK
ncbi:MAG TPA: HEAT repeat domain-containing protein, partial [Methylomirabilota bacterium]|nr:HEAT repeat domain-containing protein [Methylomirabilota bacterium]